MRPFSKSWLRKLLPAFALVALVALPLVAEARRSGGSFGGRGGFRAAPRVPSSTGTAPVGGGGPGFIFLPSFGWGYGGYGMGGGSPFGSLFMLGILGVGAFLLVRAVRRARVAAEHGHGGATYAGPDGRAFVYKVQIGLGRSARAIRERLERFAAEGDTATETGLGQLLSQTAVELLRERDSIRHAGLEGSGPLSLTNAETKMNGLALAERSRFSVERIRGADGSVRRAVAPTTESPDALEVVLVTVIVATRNALDLPKEMHSHADAEAALTALGGVSPSDLLGLEVVWTPADPEDALTETEMQTSYPTLRSL